MARWRKNGGPSVAALPPYDVDAAGEVRTSLATEAEGRAACGWVEAGVPDEIGMVEARAVLRDAGLLDDVDAWVLLQPPLIQDAWRRPTLRRNSPLLIAAAAAKGLTGQQLDDLFIAAEAFASANHL